MVAIVEFANNMKVGNRMKKGILILFGSLLIVLSLFCSSALANSHNSLVVANGKYSTAYIDENKNIRILGSSITLARPIRYGVKENIIKGEWKDIAIGSDNVVAIKSDGTLYTWGFNDFGQIGDGTTEDRYEIVQISDDSNWDQVSTTYAHVLALKKDGSLWAWGYNENSQLGNGSKNNILAPIRIGKDNDWAQIETGAYDSFGIKKDGSLWIWGGDVTRPKLFNDNKDCSKISASDSHFFILKKDGSLLGWGDNLFGQLGNGYSEGEHSDVPEPIRIGSDNNWKDVSAGSKYSVGVKDDGTLWEWGCTNKSNVPKQVGEDNDWIRAIAGYSHSIAIKEDGSIWTWGNNGDGQCNTSILKGKINEPTNINTVIEDDLRNRPIDISKLDNNHGIEDLDGMSEKDMIKQLMEFPYLEDIDGYFIYRTEDNEWCRNHMFGYFPSQPEMTEFEMTFNSGKNYIENLYNVDYRTYNKEEYIKKLKWLFKDGSTWIADDGITRTSEEHITYWADMITEKQIVINTEFITDDTCIYTNGHSMIRGRMIYIVESCNDMDWLKKYTRYGNVEIGKKYSCIVDVSVIQTAGKSGARWESYPKVPVDEFLVRDIMEVKQN